MTMPSSPDERVYLFITKEDIKIKQLEVSQYDIVREKPRKEILRFANEHGIPVRYPGYPCSVIEAFDFITNKSTYDIILREEEGVLIDVPKKSIITEKEFFAE